MWLSTENIITDQSSLKLDHKMIDIFKVIRKKDISLKLQLLQAMKLNNVFHLNIVQKISIDPLSDEVNEPAPQVIVNNQEEWEVENISPIRSFREKIQHRVKWKSCNKDQKWYDSSRFDNSSEIVENFYACHSNKPQSWTKNKT